MHKENHLNLVTIAGGKESILDVKARDSANRQFNVEIQVFNDSAFRNRTLYYWAKLYTEQLGEGEKYGDLNPVICINVLDYVQFKGLDRPHSCFLPLEMTQKDMILCGQMQIHFFELPKMNLDVRNNLHTRLEKWAYFFIQEGRVSEEELERLLLKGDSIMKKAHESYQKFTIEDQYKELYDAREKARKDEASRNHYAHEEGRKEGREEGLKEGLGESSRKMKKHGLTEKQIAEMLEITLSEVEQYLKR
ncbi:MAG: Rpn family recombination-promoting nuclease/putative transposase [Spirochaetales bacterium]|nr:Rpn family recombination-promoting nuclease/putative transposase [Spirochaetales bacterium]